MMEALVDTGTETDNSPKTGYESHSRVLQDHSHHSNGSRDRSTTTMASTSNQGSPFNNTLYKIPYTRMVNKCSVNKNCMYLTQIKSREYTATVPSHVYKNRDNRDTHPPP